MLWPVAEGGREQASIQFQGLQAHSEVGDCADMVSCIGWRGMTVVEIIAEPSRNFSP